MLELIFGILILGIVIFIALRVFHSLALGIILIVLVFVASYFILGSFPELKSVPLIGKHLPKTTGDAIAIVKQTLYSIDIIGISRDSENNLLITLANTGIKDVSGFRVFVDNQSASIINNPRDPLKSRQTTIIQVEWNGNFTQIVVQADQTNAIYFLKD
ncbi:MAG: hypothetical protein QXO27_03240 [Candidatus Aenigmatarchaeota archaeon]